MGKSFVNGERQQSTRKLSEKGANKQGNIEVMKKIKRCSNGKEINFALM